MTKQTTSLISAEADKMADTSSGANSTNGKPKVKAIIACAMKEEIAPFLDAATHIQDALTPENPNDFQYFAIASLAGQPVLLVRSGIGMTNAAIAATRALEWFETDLYILAGTMGGLAQQVDIGEVVAGTSALYHEADATAFGYELGQVPQMPALYSTDLSDLELPGQHQGLIMSGNSFMTIDNVAEVRELFPDALAVDMESTAVAQVCHLRATNWVSLRAVSDLCGPTADQDFHMQADQASALSCQAVIELLNSLR